jgi:uncharacterized protein YndB with AHSA1/START domain
LSQPSDPEPIRIERTFDAPAEIVFDAWTSPEVLKRWWHAEHNWETPLAEVDLRVEGALRIVMRDPASGSEQGGGGHFTFIDRPRRLAYTWTWDADDESRSQHVEVQFHESGGRTTVVLTNSGIPTPEIDDYHDGWNNSFDNLTAYLSRP